MERYVINKSSWITFSAVASDFFDIAFAASSIFPSNFSVYQDRSSIFLESSIVDVLMSLNLSIVDVLMLLKLIHKKKLVPSAVKIFTHSNRSEKKWSRLYTWSDKAADFTRNIS